MAEEKKAKKPTAAKSSTQKPPGKDSKKSDVAASASTPAIKDESLDLNAISLDAPDVKPKISRAKGFKNVTEGLAHVLATFNNTLVYITDLKGNVLGWSSAGKCGFRGSKKSTAYVAQVVAQDAARQAMAHGLKQVTVRIKGPGTGRESAVRALQTIGLEILMIVDVTPVPYNGCRLRKPRRV